MPQHQSFKVECLTNRLAATITTPDNLPNLKPTIMVLHGSGNESTQQRSFYLAHFFALLGKATLRFDHSGHGLSTGHMANTSLSRRLTEAASMLPYMSQTEPLTFIGSSMGAHTGAMLTQHANVGTLVGIAPAAYGLALENLLFGPDFAYMSRLPGHFNTSAIWPILNQFQGNLLLVTAGNEEKVPRQVPQLYWETCTQAKSRTQLNIPGSHHGVQAFMAQNQALQRLYLNTLFQIVCC